jgi:hypothetical protein
MGMRSLMLFVWRWCAGPGRRQSVIEKNHGQSEVRRSRVERRAGGWRREIDTCCVM